MENAHERPVVCSLTKDGCPTSRSFFATMWDSTARLPLTLGASGALSDQHLW